MSDRDPHEPEEQGEATAAPPESEPGDAADPVVDVETDEGPPIVTEFVMVETVAFDLPVAEVIVSHPPEIAAVGDAPSGPSFERSDSGEIGAAVRALGEELGRRIDALRTMFDREIRAESTREKVVDRLHAELQEYKGDLLLNTLRPMFVDLIQLHDDMGKMIDAQGSEPDEAGARLAGVIASFRQGIEDILYRQGVEPFRLDEVQFDPRRQRAVASVPTDDPALARTIATRHRPGFLAGEKVIRPEVVSVYSSPRKGEGG